MPTSMYPTFLTVVLNIKYDVKNVPAALQQHVKVVN